MPILKEWVSFIMGDNFQVNAMIHSQDIGFSTPLTITVRQAAVAAQRTMTFQYGRPLERHSYCQVLKCF